MRPAIILYVLLLISYAKAQNPIFNPVNFSRNYHFNAMSQDDYGFLWLASNEGLVFYNGYEDYLVEKDSINGPIYCLSIQNDTLYAGSEKGHIYIVDIKKRMRIDDIKLDITSKISDFICNASQLYISSYGDGIYNYIKSTGQCEPTSFKTSSKHIYELCSLKTGQIAASSDRGIDIIDCTTSQSSHIPDLPDIIVTHIAFDTPNTLWASSYDESVFRINLDDYSITNFPFEENQTIHELILFYEKLIVSTAKGVRYVNASTGFSPILSDFAEQEFKSLLIDQENNLWLINEHNPVWKASLYFGILDALNIDGIQALGHIPGKLLVGNKNGLYLVNNKDGHSSLILHKNITCISTSENLIAVGTFSNGLYLYDKNLRLVRTLSVEDGVADASILDLGFVGESTLIASTLSGVVQIPIVAESGSWLTGKVKMLHEDLGYSYIMDILSSGDRIFLGKDKAGFSIIQDNLLTSFKYYNDSNLKLGSINSIAEAQDGSVWLSSSNLGLLKFEGDSLRRINSINYNEESYSSIVPITSNNLLMIRKSSVDLFDVQKEHIMYFNDEANLVESEPFINNYAFDNGRVWFVHNDKIYSFDPPAIDQKIHPTTSIDGVEVDLESVSLEQHRFPQSKNNFKFTFTGGWLTDPSKLSYAYNLKGYDQEWRQTRDRSVSYPHLPPGNYVFQVKAAENYVFSDEPISSYSFKIRQAFYNSVWFYVILVLLLSGIIRFLYLRDQRAKELKSKLEQKQVETQLINLKAQLNPHFLFNSFNTLSGLVEENPSKGITFIENLTDFYRHILDLGDQKLIPIKREMELVNLYQKLLKERFGNGFTIQASILDDQILIPPMTIQMLIENAIKHNQLSKKNPLIITIDQNKSHIEISNNKSLKNLSVPSTGLGLRNIYDRYKLLGYSEITIEESSKHFTVKLPNYKINKDESHNS